MSDGRCWNGVGIAVTLLLCACTASAEPTALASVTDFYGARLGMTRRDILAYAPSSRIAGGPCTTEPSDDPKQLFLACGPFRLSAAFTAAGKAWWLRASYDMSGTAATLADARAALVARHGAPTGSDGAATLAWLPPGTPAGKVQPCLGAATLLVARIELGGDTSAEPLPTVDPACLPLRSAILAERAGHRGVIVETQDPRPRVAELSRLR